MDSLYRRPLPPQLIAFASPAGRALFDASRAAGGMEAFFPLIEQFHTQAEPAFCGLGTLVVTLNALGVDPGRLWRGPWRWFSEELLDCCSPLEQVRARGITLDEFACLARCNGASTELFRPDEHDLATLRAHVRDATASALTPALVVSYHRGTLGQTGEGHFSPIGGYDPASDHALVLDVARFKYPPHWVPLPALHAAMQPIDASTGRPRGWVALRRSPRPASLLFTARCVDSGGLEAVVAGLADMQAALARGPADDLNSALRTILTAAEALPLTFARRELALREHGAAAEQLLTALHAAAIYRRIADLAPASASPEIATLLLLALPDALWSPLPAGVRDELRQLRAIDELPDALRAEVEHLRRQLVDLCAQGREAVCDRCAVAS
jgi:glutathione gamma-glutamylcysteinyltransferase